MKTISVYVKPDDADMFERAKFYARGSLSRVVADLLAEWVAKKEIEEPVCTHCGKEFHD